MRLQAIPALQSPQKVFPTEFLEGSQSSYRGSCQISKFLRYTDYSTTIGPTSTVRVPFEYRIIRMHQVFIPLESRFYFGTKNNPLSAPYATARF